MGLNPFAPFFPCLRAYRWWIIAGLALLLGVQTIFMTIPMVLKWAIDAADAGLEAEPITGLPGRAADDIALYAGAIAALAVLQWVMSFGMRWCLTGVSRFVERDLRRIYVRRLLELPMPLMAVTTRWVAGKVGRGFRRVQEQFAAMSARIQENLAGIRVIKAFALRPREVERFARLNQEYVDRNRRLIRIRSLFFPFAFLLSIYFPFIELSGSLLLALVLWYGGGQVLQEEIAWGVLVAMLQYVPRFFIPIRDMAERYAAVQVAMASSERIFELLDSEPESEGGAWRAPRARGEIEFRHVWFAYVRRRMGTARRVHHHPARGEHRAGGADRGRQKHHHQPGLPVLRRAAGCHSRRRGRHSGVGGRGPAAPHRRSTAGCVPLRRGRADQHRYGPSRDLAR